MIVKSSLKLGAVSYQFEADEKSEMEALHKAIVLANPRTTCICGSTGSENFHLTTNKDKEGNIYVNVKCNKCDARSKLGQYKAGGYFWNEFEKYVPKPKGGANEPA